MSRLVLVSICVVILSCTDVKERRVQYELHTNSKPFIIGISNPFEVRMDSTLYCTVYSEGKDISMTALDHDGSIIRYDGVFDLRSYDSIQTIALDFFERKNDSLVFQDSVTIKLERIPDPILALKLPQASWSDASALKTLKYLRSDVSIHGILIIGDLRKYRFTLIKSNGVLESVTDSLPHQESAGYVIGNEVLSLLQHVEIGDTIVFDRIQARLPDGSLRKLKELRIAVSSNT